MNNFMDENYVRTYKEKYDDEMELLKKIWKKEARKEGREKGRLEGIEQGSNKKSYEIAIKMLDRNYLIKSSNSFFILLSLVLFIILSKPL